MSTQPIAQRVARLIALALWVVAVSACGFHLRGTRELPFDSIYLGISPTSSFGAELARHVRAGTTSRVVDQAQEAQAVLEILSESRTREVLALNAQGRAREFQLRQNLSFRLLDHAGRELIGPTVLSAQRDIAFNDTEVLAKESEEALLYRDMQTDLVQQLLQRIAAARRPAAAPPTATEPPPDHATTP